MRASDRFRESALLGRALTGVRTPGLNRAVRSPRHRLRAIGGCPNAHPHSLAHGHVRHTLPFSARTSVRTSRCPAPHYNERLTESDPTTTKPHAPQPSPSDTGELRHFRVARFPASRSSDPAASTSPRARPSKASKASSATSHAAVGAFARVPVNVCSDRKVAQPFTRRSSTTAMPFNASTLRPGRCTRKSNRSGVAPARPS